MSARGRGRGRGRVALGIYLGAALLGAGGGCDRSGNGVGLPAAVGPAAPARGTWRVVRVEPTAGGPTLGGGLTLGGAAGYLRATLIVEHPADRRAGTASRTALYDSLFPIGPEARLRVGATPPTPPATAPRVTFAVESGGITSTASIEPNLPLFAPGAAVRWTPALLEGQPLRDRAEVEVGRWTVAVAGSEPVVVILRVLGSREPIGPRLKGLASSPT